MAFSTVVGSDGITSLVGTTGVDVASIFTLPDEVFIGGNTGDDFVLLDLIPDAVASDYEIRMGGGDDELDIADGFGRQVITDSFISLDGLTLANDGKDTFNADIVLFSEVVGRGGDDTFDILLLDESELNGNTDNDTIRIVDSIDSEIYGGQGNDRINIFADSVETTIYGNKGDDVIEVGFASSRFVDSAIYGGQGNDVIDVFSDSDIFVVGDLGSDTITTAGGDDDVEGADGNDILDAGAGDDDVEGGKGDDTLTGGLGADTLSGGDGTNVFAGYDVTNAAGVAATGNTGFDTITDFSSGDTIKLGVQGQVVINRGTVSSDFAGSLGQILTAEFTGANGFLFNDDVGIITITAGASNAGIAGSYVVLNNDNVAGWQADSDNVIKINSTSLFTPANIGNVVTV